MIAQYTVGSTNHTDPTGLEAQGTPDPAAEIELERRTQEVIVELKKAHRDPAYARKSEVWRCYGTLFNQNRLTEEF
jgi:hypothetical protein